MRNFKKVIALVLAVALTLSTFTIAFAAEATSASKLSDLGLLLNTSEEELGADLTRDIGLAMILKALGWDQAKANEKAAANPFTDVTQNWFKGYAGLAVEEGITVGKSATSFAPKDVLTQKEFVAFMLRALGYETEKAWDEAAALGAAAGLVPADSKLDAAVFTKADAADVMFAALKAELKGEGATGTLADKLIAAGAFTEAQAIAAGVVADELAVSSVKAKSAKSFVVVFNRTVKDTAKVAFDVKRSTTAVTVSTTWNEAKTEATLTSTTTFPEGSYTVAVKEDTKDLGTSKVDITQQKIAKIDITSTKLSVVGNGLTGYATYKVLDQYDSDITSSYLASNVKFQTGVGNATHKNGVITITSANSLIQFANVVITGYDTTSGVSVTATLATSTALGTLSDLQLGTITGPANKVLTAGDTTTVFYINYTALDMSGNETKNYDLVKGGLILSPGDLLSVSNPNVQAKVVKDPADSTKAAIELKVVSTDSVLMDMPLIITSMTYTGKTSSINATLKKAAEVDTFTLMLPEFNIAVGDVGKTIPFEAYDQNGVKITKFDDLNGKVTLSGGIAFSKNVDGTAKVVITPIISDGPQIISAVVGRTGKMSNLTINVQKAAVAESLVLDSSVFVAAMEDGATQKIDFGFDNGGLKVLDQYGREINMASQSATNYYTVKVTSANTALVTVPNDTIKDSVANNQATITAATSAPAPATPVNGSTTLTFTLFNDNGDGVGGVAGDGIQNGDERIIDTKAVTLSVIDSAEIASYSIDEVKDAIYATAGATTDREKTYAAKLKVYGKTSGGAKVLLAGTPVTGAYVTNATDFVVTSIHTAPVAYDVARVTAKAPADPAKTGASTIATVTLNHNGAIQSLSTTINSSTTAPVAQTVGIDVEDFVTGLSVDGDVVSIAAASLVAANFVDGASMAKFDSLGATPGTQSKVVFYAKDQYGKKAMQLVQFNVVSQSVNAGTIAIDNQGVLDLTSDAVTINAGDEVTISAVSNNGLVKTIKIEFK